MEYLTAHYWQQEDEGTTLVLQHLMYRKEQLPMVFACVCRSQGDMGEGCFTKQLTDWFQWEGRELLRRDKGEVLEQTKKTFCQVFAKLEEQMTQYARTLGREYAPPSFCGILCVDKRFLLFHRGEQKIFLLNTRFERASCKELFGKERASSRELSGRGEALLHGLTAACGILEPKLGILLATEGFCDKLSKQQLCECLSSKELSSPQRLQKRLKELGDEAARQGAKGQGAILVVTQ